MIFLFLYLFYSSVLLLPTAAKDSILSFTVNPSSGISPYGIIIIPGMAKKLEGKIQDGFDTFAVHVKGRASTPVKNNIMRKVIDETGLVLTPEFDDGSLNEDIRMAYFHTVAISRGDVYLSFFQKSLYDGSIYPIQEMGNTAVVQLESDGDFSSIVNVKIPSSQAVYGSKLYYNVSNVPVMNYAILAADEGYCIVTDVDDTIRVSGVAWLPSLYELAFRKKFKVAPTMPEYFSLLQTGLTVTTQFGMVSPPTYHYLSGSPQQFLPVLQAWTETHYPLGEFILPPLAASDGYIFGLRRYFEFKVVETIKIIEFFPTRKLILFGDATQFDAEAYAQVYIQYPDHIQCIFIRLVEGFNSIVERRKNNPYRFLRAFLLVPHSKWMVFRNTTELPSPEEIMNGQCRDPNWFQQ